MKDDGVVQCIAHVLFPYGKSEEATLTANSILDALTAKGLAIAPVEPDEKMIDAAQEFHSTGRWDASDNSFFGGMYRAMLAALLSPTPEQKEG